MNSLSILMVQQIHVVMNDRMIRNVLDTKDMGLKLRPTGVMGEPWRMLVFMYSDYVGDSGSHRSVSGSGCIHYLQ